MKNFNVDSRNTRVAELLPLSLMTALHQNNSVAEGAPDLAVEPLPPFIEGPEGPIPVIGRDMRGQLILELNAASGYALPPGYAFAMDGLD